VTIGSTTETAIDLCCTHSATAVDVLSPIDHAKMAVSGAFVLDVEVA
jgi:hypothetical protein